MLDRLDALGIVLPRERDAEAGGEDDRQGDRPAGDRAAARGARPRARYRRRVRSVSRRRAGRRSCRGAARRRPRSSGSIARAGGVVSFAHPGKLGLDDLIPPLAARGTRRPIEVFHPDHDAAAVERYGAMARALGLAVSGGSDYHGPGSGRAEALGQVTLPPEAFDESGGARTARGAARMTPTPPLIQIGGARPRHITALRPLRMADFSVSRGDRLVLSGFDEGAAEMFVYLVTGAALPDEGARRDRRPQHARHRDRHRMAVVARSIRDRHASRRAARGLSVAANLALPLTLSIDPMAADVRARVDAGRHRRGLARRAPGRAGHALSADERLRLHLARAAAVGPELIMLEHPTRRSISRGSRRRSAKRCKRCPRAAGSAGLRSARTRSFAKARAEQGSGSIRATGRDHGMPAGRLGRLCVEGSTVQVRCNGAPSGPWTAL